MHTYQQSNTTTKPPNPRDISTKILPFFAPTPSSLPANKLFANWWLVAAVPCVTASQLIGWGYTLCVSHLTKDVYSEIITNSFPPFFFLSCTKVFPHTPLVKLIFAR